ncbi:ATP-grasp domain-containing protein [Halorhodospira halophila]|nr:ATP-grasp domain-containing protein [Halorhodospira halophila]
MKFGVINPQPYMEPALAELEQHFGVERIYPKGWGAREIEATARHCHEQGVVAVAGFAQKDAFHHLLINERLGNPVPSRVAFFYCMNKYLMRTLERDPFFYAPVDPLQESDDQIAARVPAHEWPFMLKNTSLSLGRGIFRIASVDELQRVLADYRQDHELQRALARQYAAYLDGVPPQQVPALAPPFIAEHLVDINRATEYCYEGYITNDGEVVHYGLTEEVYFSNHQALGYLTPPVSISRDMADTIEAWVSAYMRRLADLGYRNQFFNLEFWVMPDGALHLTEINPRAAHTYHYNYRYSFGNSLYADNLLLAAGEQPARPTPWDRWRAGGSYRYTLIVLITARESGRVDEILDYDYVDALEAEQGVLVRHVRRRDEVIDESELSAAGVMLQQLWITAPSSVEIIAREREIRSRIYRNRQDAVAYPPFWRI